jgi:hypothetical protein
MVRAAHTATAWRWRLLRRNQGFEQVKKLRELGARVHTPGVQGVKTARDLARKAAAKKEKMRSTTAKEKRTPPPQPWFSGVVDWLEGRPFSADRVDKAPGAGKTTKISKDVAPKLAAFWWHHMITPARRREIRSEVKAKKNPRPDLLERDLGRAVRLYEEFHDRPAERLTPVEIPDPPAVSLKLGDLTQVNYSRIEQGRRVEFFHKFGSRRPKLLTDPQGRFLYVIGGRFRIRDVGIVG